MKTFSEILLEHWRKSKGYKKEQEAGFKENILDNPDAAPLLAAVEEYAAQFKCNCATAAPEKDLNQKEIFHHQV